MQTHCISGQGCSAVELAPRQRNLSANVGRSWKAAVLSLATMAAITIGVRSTLRINFTGSLPQGVYRKVTRLPSRGAVVLVCLPPGVGAFARTRRYVWRGDCPGGVAPVGKVIAAVGGDTVTATDGGLLVNGHSVPNSRPLRQDRQGRPVQRVSNGVYVVSPGEVWLTSSHSSASFDSRYFGPVPTSAVISRIEPLWVFGSAQ